MLFPRNLFNSWIFFFKFIGPRLLIECDLLNYLFRLGGDIPFFITDTGYFSRQQC